MIDLKGIDWERLKRPTAHLRVMNPTPEMLVILSEKLLTTPMALPDEHRNAEWVDLIVASMFSGPQFNWVYDIGDGAGVLGFMDIWPEYKAETSFVLWDNEFMSGPKSRAGLRGHLCWGADFIRELQDVAALIMQEFKLKRLGLATPEEATIKIVTKFLKFKVEGRQKYGFRHEGKTYTQNLLRRVGE